MKTNLVTKAKKTLKTHSTKLYIAAVSVATLGATYYYGKSKGELNVQVLLKTADHDYVEVPLLPPEN